MKESFPENTCLGPDAHSPERLNNTVFLGYLPEAFPQTGDCVVFGDPDGSLTREWKKARENMRLGWAEKITEHDNIALSPKSLPFGRWIIYFLVRLFQKPRRPA